MANKIPYSYRIYVYLKIFLSKLKVLTKKTLIKTREIIYLNFLKIEQYNRFEDYITNQYIYSGTVVQNNKLKITNKNVKLLTLLLKEDLGRGSVKPEQIAACINGGLSRRFMKENTKDKIKEIRRILTIHAISLSDYKWPFSTLVTPPLIQLSTYHFSLYMVYIKHHDPELFRYIMKGLYKLLTIHMYYGSGYKGWITNPVRKEISRILVNRRKKKYEDLLAIIYLGYCVKEYSTMKYGYKAVTDNTRLFLSRLPVATTVQKYKNHGFI